MIRPPAKPVLLSSLACLALGLASLLSPSCTSDAAHKKVSGVTGPTGAAGVTGPTGPTTTLTYYHDVKPIVDAKCIGCHVTGGIGPFDLTTYAGVHMYGALISPYVASKAMPPWMPSTDTPPIVGDRSLSDSQISTITSWVAGGMPEGDPASAPTEMTPPNDFTASFSMQVAQPYTPSTALGTDDYHCFVLDPGLTADTAVTAFNILPGDRRIVHHVLLYAVAPSALSDLQAAEATGNGNGYTCFGGPGGSSTALQESAQLVAAWAPGAQATVFTPGTGIVVTAGSQLAMQVHYNLLNAPNPMMPPSDQTTAQLQYAAVSSVTRSEFYLVADTTFDIPVDVIQTTNYTLDTGALGLPSGASIYLYAVLPHMHLHGTDIEVTVTHASDMSTDVLMHIPKWQFQWQAAYFYQHYLTVTVGDQVNLSCTFDNTAADQPIIAGVQETPERLTWGEDTLNEMCLAFLYVAASPPAQ